MSEPAIIPGKRFSPWRYFMNSIFINRFSAVAMWHWLAGMSFGLGAGSQNAYLMFAGITAAALGGWPAVVWETEREEKEKAARPVSGAGIDDDETLDRRIRGS